MIWFQIFVLQVLNPSLRKKRAGERDKKGNKYNPMNVAVFHAMQPSEITNTCLANYTNEIQ